MRTGFITTTMTSILYEVIATVKADNYKQPDNFTKTAAEAISKQFNMPEQTINSESGAMNQAAGITRKALDKLARKRVCYFSIGMTAASSLADAKHTNKAN